MSDTERKMEHIKELLGWLPEGERHGWLDAQIDTLKDRRDEEIEDATRQANRDIAA